MLAVQGCCQLLQKAKEQWQQHELMPVHDPVSVMEISFTWSEGEGTEAPCELSRVAWDSGRGQRSGYSPGTQHFAQKAGARLAELAKQPAWHNAQQLAI